MNTWMLLLFIGLAIGRSGAFFGIVIGLLFCYLFLDGRGDNSSIKYHLTHWSWWDIRV